MTSFNDVFGIICEHWDDQAGSEGFNEFALSMGAKFNGTRKELLVYGDENHIIEYYHDCSYPIIYFTMQSKQATFVCTAQRKYDNLVVDELGVNLKFLIFTPGHDTKYVLHITDTDKRMIEIIAECIGIASIQIVIESHDGQLPVPKEIRVFEKSIKDILDSKYSDCVVCLREYEFAESGCMKIQFEAMKQRNMYFTSTITAAAESDEESVQDEPEEDQGRACPICYSHQKKFCLIPCGHSFCGRCSCKVAEKQGESRVCPLCRSSFVRRQRIF